MGRVRLIAHQVSGGEFREEVRRVASVRDGVLKGLVQAFEV